MSNPFQVMALVTQPRPNPAGPSGATLPPCVVQSLQRTGLTGIEALTWCGRKASADGLLQLPIDAIQRCADCEASVTGFAAKMASMASGATKIG